MTQNPAWPVIDEAISPPNGPNSAAPFDLWMSVMARAEGTLTTRRGRQYELDQVQTGESTVTLRNTDGAFDPDNQSSPFWPHIVPYRGHRRRAQYPPTVNLLLRSQATAGLLPDTPGGSALPLGTLPPSVSGVNNGAPTTITDTGATNDYQLAYPPAPGTNSGMFMAGFSCTPGQTVSAQCQARLGSGAAIQMRLAIQWIGYDPGVGFDDQVGFDQGAAVTLTGANQQLTVTSTMPANAFGGYLFAWTASSPASASTVLLSQFQLEQAAAPSGYVAPSIWYPLITDFVLEWPQTWQDGGTYGLSNLRCVDAFGYLSQRTLKSPAYMELLALSPTFFYPLDEASNSQIFADMAGNRQPAGAAYWSGATTAELSPGSQLGGGGDTVQGGFFPRGIGGPVVNFTPAAGHAVSVATAGVLIPGVPGGNPVGPPVGQPWTRIVAFAVAKTTPPLPGQYVLWDSQDRPGINGYTLFINAANGALAFQLVQNATVVLNTQITGNIADGSWHLVAVSMAQDGQTVNYWTTFGGLVGDTNPFDMHVNCAGGIETYGSTAQTNPFTGQMAFLAELPFFMDNASWTKLINTFRYGGTRTNANTTTETSGFRYADVLRWARWAGASTVDTPPTTFPTGQTIDYGPPVDLLATAADQGTDTVTAGQNVVTTENGNHYVAADGTVTFKARRARYNQTIPVVIFGENTTAGEVPYTDAGFGFDPTRLINDAALNQPSTSLPIRVYDQPSINTYGHVPLQRDVNSLDVTELIDAANFLVDRYRQPAQRLQKITIDVAANPTAWPLLLALELGSRVRVMRRPPDAPLLQFEGFVEHINWTITDQVTATVDLEVSSAAGLTYEVAGSTRMTLKTAVTAGATTAVVNPLPDAATDPIRADLSAADSLPTWVIDWGTPAAELVQITSIPVTSPGYTSATLGIGLCATVPGGIAGTGFQNTHAANAVLQDIGGAYEFTTATTLAQLVAQLNPSLVPAGALDAFCILGQSTILGY